MEGQVTEVVEGKAWVVPGVLSPEVSQLFSHSQCHHGGAKQIMILGNFRITTSISITIITISITLVISQYIAIKRIIISIIMAISIQHS